MTLLAKQASQQGTETPKPPGNRTGLNGNHSALFTFGSMFIFRPKDNSDPLLAKNE